MTQILTMEITILAGAISVLFSILLGVIIYELRALRKDLKERVPDAMCRVMMKTHEDRISKLENHRNNQNNFYQKRGKN